MKHEISSLMDGELAPSEAERAIKACCASEEQLESWHLYHVIGDSMRGHAPRTLEPNLAFRAVLKNEPAMIARPRRVLESTFARISLAAAASVATLGIVGWIGSQGGTPAGVPMAAKSPAIQPVLSTATAPPAKPPAFDTREYEVAHRQVPRPDIYTVSNNKALAPGK